MPAGLGGGGSVGVAFETTMGTYVAPTTFVPILSEGLKYTEEKYYSPQIRQQTIVSDVKSGYYHAEGPINMEVDPRFIIYFLYASRHTVVKAGAGPYTYRFIPSSAGSASTATGTTTPKTLSITVQ
jgi:Phage tail tube protein